MLKYVLSLLLVTAAIGTAWAEVFSAPKLASLSDDIVNVRAGPGERYPILWTFHRHGWPVQLIAEYQTWYKIRDMEGEEGWIYKGLVSTKPTAVISAGEPAPLYRRAKGDKVSHLLAPEVVVALAEPGCIGPALCEVEVGNAKGYIDPARLVRF